MVVKCLSTIFYTCHVEVLHFFFKNVFKYFNLINAIIDGIVSLISLLVYRNTIEVYALILYAAILLKPFISFSSFF